MPYYLHYKVGPAIVVRGQLPIEAGVQILVEAGLGIIVRDSGTLTAVGTADDRISISAKVAPWMGP